MAGLDSRDVSARLSKIAVDAGLDPPSGPGQEVLTRRRTASGAPCGSHPTNREPALSGDQLEAQRAEGGAAETIRRSGYAHGSKCCEHPRDSRRHACALRKVSAGDGDALPEARASNHTHKALFAPLGGKSSWSSCNTSFQRMTPSNMSRVSGKPR
jgi:hypothetical protein